MTVHANLNQDNNNSLIHLSRSIPSCCSLSPSCSTSSGIGSSSPDLEDRQLERIVIALPVIPVDPIAKTFVLPTQVKTVQVGIVAGAVPPGTREPFGAIFAPGIIVPVNCAEEQIQMYSIMLFLPPAFAKIIPEFGSSCG